MKTPQVMVIGFGDLARRLVPKLSGAAEIVGVSRRPELLPEGVKGVFGDYTQRDTLAEAASLTPDVVIFTPVPASRDLEGYRLGYAQAARNICEAGVLTYAERAIFV
ncbi:MAG: NAD-binding protein, partial [Pseudomonadota bacterium]|nr:NAD-binding protein [Pseudomonadota bacterium]